MAPSPHWRCPLTSNLLLTGVFGGSGNTHAFTMPAQNVTVNATFAIDLATITSDYTIPNGAIVKGELGTNVKICVAEGASIMLKGMNIGMNADGSNKWGSGDYAGLTCLGDATINLADGTVNKIMSIGGGNPGIHIKTGTLVIQGNGTLMAYSHDGTAGIGCGDSNPKGATVAGVSTCGDITISGGLPITAGRPFFCGFRCF